MDGDFCPTISQAKTLADRKINWSFTLCAIHEDKNKAGKMCCQMIDGPTGRVLSEAYGRGLSESFNLAFTKLPEPASVDSVETVDELRKKIAELEAQVSKPPSITRGAKQTA